MIRGLYVSALGMTVQMNKMDITANNLANADTTGYKRDIAATRAFSERLLSRVDEEIGGRRLGAIEPGVFVDDIYVDFRSGALNATGGPLDFALSGEGFFIVNAVSRGGEQSVKYTRDGMFSRDASGRLVTREGFAVQGQSGDVTLPDGLITSDRLGNIYVNGKFIDRIAVTDFEDKRTLRPYGDSMYDETPDSARRAFLGEVSGGFLEKSNVNSVREMVSLITVSRAYEANQRMVTIHDSTLEKAVNEVGRKYS
ncbi:MAG: flagellar hook-basal body protein [Clostridiales bacterium]|nr:flagellar hook-basal body protein [Clostridiales bacterium]